MHCRYRTRISWAIYAELGPDDAHFYRFEVPTQSLQFFAQMTLPANQDRDFVPCFALIGPELPREFSMPARLPVDYGTLIAPVDDVRQEFLEPFTQTRYLPRHKMQEELGAGTHYLVVFHPNGGQGRYALTVGERAAWSWHDLLAFPFTWSRVRWWYSEVQTVVLVSVMAVAAGVTIRAVIHRINTTAAGTERLTSLTRRLRTR